MGLEREISVGHTVAALPERAQCRKAPPARRAYASAELRYGFANPDPPASNVCARWVLWVDLPVLWPSNPLQQIAIIN